MSCRPWENAANYSMQVMEILHNETFSGRVGPLIEKAQSIEQMYVSRHGRASRHLAVFCSLGTGWTKWVTLQKLGDIFRRYQGVPNLRAEDEASAKTLDTPGAVDQTRTRDLRITRATSGNLTQSSKSPKGPKFPHQRDL